MTIFRATVKMVKRSGIPADNVVNVWHFEADTVTGDQQAIADEIGSQLSDKMYGNSVLCNYLGHSLLRNVGDHFVDVSVLTPGAPGSDDDTATTVISSTPFALTAIVGTTTPFPSEVAIALSFRGDIAGLSEEGPLNTRPANRKRGRIFYGPLNTFTGAQDTLGRLIVAETFWTAMRTAYETMLGLLNGFTHPIYHVVYSPTNGTVARVQVLSMDDAFDTVRSRGEKATVRWTEPTPQFEAP